MQVEPLKSMSDAVASRTMMAAWERPEDSFEATVDCSFAIVQNRDRFGSRARDPAGDPRPVAI